MEIVERRRCAGWLDVQICDWIDGTLPTKAFCTSRKSSMENMRAIISYRLPAYPRNPCCKAPSVYILNRTVPAQPYPKAFPSNWADTKLIHTDGRSVIDSPIL